jgi:hypothetical protein
MQSRLNVLKPQMVSTRVSTTPESGITRHSSRMLSSSCRDFRSFANWAFDPVTKVLAKKLHESWSLESGHAAFFQPADYQLTTAWRFPGSPPVGFPPTVEIVKAPRIPTYTGQIAPRQTAPANRRTRPRHLPPRRTAEGPKAAVAPPFQGLRVKEEAYTTTESESDPHAAFNEPKYTQAEMNMTITTAAKTATVCTSN